MPGRAVPRPKPPRFTHALDIHAYRSFEFVTGALKRKSHVLEVGCGEGRLARRLTRAGHRVTAIDIDADAVKRARRRGVDAHVADMLSYENDCAYDAVVFVLSLHHILPSLARAIMLTHTMLKPGGLLIADEFGRERMNRETARWFYDILELLNATGVFAPGVHDRHHGHGAKALPDDPLDRWHAHHLHDPPLHTARAMRAAIARRFRIISDARGPHLYRYPCRRMRPGTTGVRAALRVLEIESRRIADGTLRPAGMQLVAQKK
jgi:SAM-dependent methyltransferase